MSIRLPIVFIILCIVLMMYTLYSTTVGCEHFVVIPKKTNYPKTRLASSPSRNKRRT